MAFPPEELSSEAIEFLNAPRCIGTLGTVDAKGRPHAASVGYTYDHEARLVRIVTMPGSQKVRNIERTGYANLNQITGMMWLQVQGPTAVKSDPESLAAAYEAFAARYGRHHEGDVLIAVELRVERCLGPHNGWGRIGFLPTAPHS